MMNQKIIQPRMETTSTCQVNILYLKDKQLELVEEYNDTTTCRSYLLSRLISTAGTEITACLHST